MTKVRDCQVFISLPDLSYCKPGLESLDTCTRAFIKRCPTPPHCMFALHITQLILFITTDHLSSFYCICHFCVKMKVKITIKQPL
mmetsp:Transcript_11462/g.18665  ORF Transcript_11462/g.18665 Transcript_11462/m.18665 type:complete len:85 (-) Transcript_11462:12-266(-)